MSKFIKLSLKSEGLKVHNPATNLFLEDGEQVEYNQYWRRRLAEGDVTILKEETKKDVRVKKTETKIKKTTREE